jgi:hypothetical protein
MPNPENLEKGTWKPGESGNPAGKPKGTLNRSTIARKWLEVGEKFKNPITGKEEQLSQEDIITLGQIKEARKGNTNAYKALMDSAHGMPKQEIDQNLHIGEKQSFKIGDQIITFE